ncbi:MAG TPA: bifunctional pyr operon transcriptional regulator/uracil phosphoribosyltransferase PyrR [Rhodocyclaceae bacterium]|nr:bifunctional pyr operon transcriptional regulator/uracil phosphoribosyltransferase PyrR [Rhodocyclaceae bacterium]
MELPDANSLCKQLADLIRPHVTPETALIGVHSGGVWLAEYLHRELGIAEALGCIDVAFYRDDYASRGLHARPRRSDIPFDVDGRSIIVVDDVLYTGRTTRAALNEIFDYGRPGRIDLAVLVDRGERQLPIAARYCPYTLPQALPAGSRLRLSRSDGGKLSLQLIEGKTGDIKLDA